MIDLTSMIAVAGTPVGWALVALLAVIMLAPSVLPSLAKLAGRMMQREVRRRLGIADPPPPPRARQSPVVEVLPPDPPVAPSPPPRNPQIIEVAPLPPRRSHRAIWWTAAGALGVLVVLSWILFHSR